MLWPVVSNSTTTRGTKKMRSKVNEMGRFMRLWEFPLAEEWLKGDHYRECRNATPGPTTLSQLTITDVQRSVNALPIFENRKPKIEIRKSKLGSPGCGSVLYEFRISSFDFRLSNFGFLLPPSSIGNRQ
jgi:hypothetical protein